MFFILILFIAIGFSIFALFFTDSVHSPIAWVSLIVALLCIYSLASKFATMSEQPKAIDVYRGKTELRVTYEGKIPVDSCVIYKRK